MNFWIERKRDALTEVMRRVDAVLINEAELREYSGRYGIQAAAAAIQELGPRCVVVKRGEYGAIMFDGDRLFTAPAFPTWDVRDTTGAGDSFAGGFLGYLDRAGELSDAAIRAALVYGTIVASYTVEDFSVEGLLRCTPDAMAERYRRLAEVTRIDVPVPFGSRDLVTEGV
jgi:sugar/nucleoside kinase (ribokinase family)